MSLNLQPMPQQLDGSLTLDSCCGKAVIKGPPENYFVIFPAVTKKMEEEIVCNRW